MQGELKGGCRGLCPHPVDPLLARVQQLGCLPSVDGRAWLLSLGWTVDTDHPARPLCCFRGRVMHISGCWPHPPSAHPAQPPPLRTLGQNRRAGGLWISAWASSRGAGADPRSPGGLWGPSPCARVQQPRTQLRGADWVLPPRSQMADPTRICRNLPHPPGRSAPPSPPRSCPLHLPWDHASCRSPGTSVTC